MFRRRAVPSLPAEASSGDAPSRWTRRMAWMGPSWPCSGRSTRSAVATFHTVRIPSRPPATTRAGEPGRGRSANTAPVSTSIRGAPWAGMPGRVADDQAHMVGPGQRGDRADASGRQGGGRGIGRRGPGAQGAVAAQNDVLGDLRRGLDEGLDRGRGSAHSVADGPAAGRDTRTVPSSTTEASSAGPPPGSGSAHTAQIEPVCPVSGSPTWRPVLGFHTLTVPSTPAEASMMSPSGTVNVQTSSMVPSWPVSGARSG